MAGCSCLLLQPAPCTAQRFLLNPPNSGLRRQKGTSLGWQQADPPVGHSTVGPEERIIFLTDKIPGAQLVKNEACMTRSMTPAAGADPLAQLPTCLTGYGKPTNQLYLPLLL